MHLFLKHSGWYFVLIITQVCQAFYGRVPNGPARSLYPSMHVRDKVNNNRKFQISQKYFQNVQLFPINTICKCGHFTEVCLGRDERRLHSINND